jgi:hypothetical protein
VIGKITAQRGERAEGLIYYLFGPGRREEHAGPHIVAGWRHPAGLEPPRRPDGGRGFRRLGLLNQPHAAMGAWGLAQPVWHCSVRVAPDDTMLSDGDRSQRDGVMYTERSGAADSAKVNADLASDHDSGDRTAAQLAAESFPAPRRTRSRPPPTPDHEADDPALGP